MPPKAASATPTKEKRNAASPAEPPKKKQFTPEMVKKAVYSDIHKEMIIDIVPCKRNGRLTGNHVAEIKLPLVLAQDLENADLAMRKNTPIKLDTMMFVASKSIYVIKIFYKNQLELLAKNANRDLATMIRESVKRIDFGKIKLKDISLVEVAVDDDDARGAFRASSEGPALGKVTELIIYGQTYFLSDYAKANGWTWQSNYLGVRGFECWVHATAAQDEVAAELKAIFEIDDIIIAECTSAIAAQLA